MAGTVDEYFEDKADSKAIFDAVEALIARNGPAEMNVGSQISFGRRRKFAWFWLYNQTKKNPDGVPHLVLALDHAVDSEHVRHIEQIGKRRWNHQIVVRTLDDAQSSWLADLVDRAYRYGGSRDQ